MSVRESIFGGECPKIIYHEGLEDQTEVSLRYWVPELTDFGEENIITHEAELTCDRAFIPQGGNFLEYSGFIHLFKYGNEAQITAKFNEIYALNHKQVLLHRHSDGKPYKKDSTDTALFFLQVYPMNLRTTDYRDLLYIRFRSLQGINIGLIERYLVDDTDRSFLDDEGRTFLDDL